MNLNPIKEQRINKKQQKGLRKVKTKTYKNLSFKEETNSSNGFQIVYTCTQKFMCDWALRF